MDNLHLLPNDKFTNAFLLFINKRFEMKRHHFLILGHGKFSNAESKPNVIQLDKNLKSIILLIKNLNKAINIHIHGLFHPQLVLLLVMQPWLLKKCNWIIWGGDLYDYRKLSRNLREEIYESCRRFVIKRLGRITTQVKGDYELAKEWYDTRAEYCYSFMYPSNLYKKIDLSFEIEDDKHIYIQVGNSADPSNHHLEVLEKLLYLDNSSIKVICPLSYGNVEYQKLVIEEGTKKFGERFIPLVEFIPFEDYLNLLAKIDVAIFNHDRQQALGNITTLLGLGKKVYIREDITTWRFCIEHGLKVFGIKEEFNDLLKVMKEEDKLSNEKVMKENFSEEKLARDWSKIFNSGV
jgi:dTDP-N-acetylfucosamine:lipid II N-acetylfucosaminyltransferase